MSTTIVRKYTWPIGMKMEEERYQGDCDKAGDIDDAHYYQGYVDAMNDLLFTMTFPRTEDDARECIHAHMVWFGHECGLCASSTAGYQWAEEA
jgi:hypothetical protein